MATPTLDDITPTTGPTSGGELVWLYGGGFSESISVRFGQYPADVISQFDQDEISTIIIRTPFHDAGTVDVEIRNLDTNGNEIPDGATLCRRTVSCDLGGAFRDAFSAKAG